MGKIVYESLDEFDLNEDWKSKLAKGIAGAAFMGAMAGTPLYGQTSETPRTEKFSNVSRTEKIMPGVDAIKKDNQLLIYFSGQNPEYSHIVDMVSYYLGEPQGFYNLLSEIEEFIEQYKDEDGDISADLSNGNRISLYKKTLFLYGINDDRDKATFGNIKLMNKGVSKMKQTFLDWCQKNNIEIK